MKARTLGSAERAHHLCVRRRYGCSVALGVKKRVPRALLRRRARSVLTKERTAPIACDVHVSGNDRRERRRGDGNVGGLALGTNRRREPSSRRYRGAIHSVRRRRAASRRTGARPWWPTQRRSSWARSTTKSAGGLRCQHHSETGALRRAAGLGVRRVRGGSLREP